MYYDLQHKIRHNNKYDKNIFDGILSNRIIDFVSIQNLNA